MANEKYQNRLPEIRVSGVAEIIKTQIDNIAKNTGMSTSDFLKPHLRKIADSYPEHMKKPPLSY